MDMLQVSGSHIINARGETVRLRGPCIGGWMNMEDFINGYPGCEHDLRATMSEILGPDKARFFFNRLLDYFFNEDDVAFIKSCGANVVRLPLNYRHFEQDDNPFVYLEEGFTRLNQAVTWCAKHGLYVILDLHSVQGWQNTDWHCDNSSRHTFFWQHKQFQDRFVALWEEFARRYKNNPAIAGYDLINEPITNTPNGRLGLPYVPDWEMINRIYRRVVKAIRLIDSQHIIFLEGDMFAKRLEGLELPFTSNLVYSSHIYTPAGFGPGPYPGKIGGVDWNAEEHKRAFQDHSGTIFTRQHQVPLWVGEFGSLYNGPEVEIADRLRSMDDQISTYEKAEISWTPWTYKDISVMGWVQLAPDTEYLQLIAPILEAKKLLAVDFWQRNLSPTPIKMEINRLADQILDLTCDPEVNPVDNRNFLAQQALSGYAALILQRAYARCFLKMSEADLDRVLLSFALNNCREQPVLQIVKKYLL